MIDLTPNDLRRLRRRAGWTQAEAARIVGYAPKTFSRYERGKSAMPPSALRAFLVAVEAVLRNQDDLLARVSRHIHAA